MVALRTPTSTSGRTATCTTGPTSFFGLKQSLPNPFRSSTTINYQLQAAGAVSLKVYNIAGQLVRTLVDGAQGAGARSVQWDGKDNHGRAVSAGVYHYRLASGGRQQTKTLLHIK